MRGRAARGLGAAILFEEMVTTFPRQKALALGFVQMLLGIASFVGAILAEIYYAYNFIIYDGFWCGSFFFMAASAILHAGRWPTRRRIRGTIVCSVISFAFVGTEFGLSVDGLYVNVNYPESDPYGFTNVDYDFPAMEAANGLMLSACAVEMILLIFQIHICVRALKEFKPLGIGHTGQVVMPPMGHMGHMGPMGPMGQTYMQPTITVIGTQQPTFVQPQQQWYATTEFAAPPAYNPIAPPAYTN